MDLSLILIGLPVTFLLGWLASRIDLKQLRLENRQSPKAYFKGLNFLLNEQQDQAIDAFIEAVQLDPDTSELHFALGNLFRKRGEYDRAVRVHEHLIARADLSQADRDRAQYALAMDFVKAGILDRAETVLQSLRHTSFASQANLALLSLYERTRDWAQAAEAAKALQAGGQGNFDTRRAHYLCEQAASLTPLESSGAQRLLEQAMQIAPKADRPMLALADLLTAQGEFDRAFVLLEQLIEANRPATPLAAPLYAQLARRTGRQPAASAVLRTSYSNNHSLNVLEAIVGLLAPEGTDRSTDHDTQTQAQTLFLEHLKLEPSLIAAERWLQLETQSGKTIAPAIEQAITRATRPLRKYRCAACGFETQQHHWNCPGCQAWDSYPPRPIEEL
jgi:lipopolysaccharide biosynthesis regulator YciM